MALNLAVERHLLARPSLATEMHKQKEKENMHRTIKIQHEHQTSTSALQMLNPYVDKNDWLVLAGKKTSWLRKFAVGKKCFKISDRREYQCLE